MKFKFFVSTVLLVFCSLSHAGSCEKLEYAEIKDMPKDQLIKKFCLYGGLARIDRDTATQLMPLNSAKANQYHVSSGECLDQQEKIYRTLKNKYKLKDYPSCEQ